MTFRASDVAAENRQNAERYLLSNLMHLSKCEREKSKVFLHELLDEMGPVVDSYPIWHPLLIDKSKWSLYRKPNNDCGYSKLDHNVLFTDGFITCPYNANSNFGQDVINVINSFSVINGLRITAQKLPVTLYHPDTTAILVKCSRDLLDSDKYMTMESIMPFLLHTSLEIYNKGPKIFSIDEMMQDYLLGKPCGKRSSLFVNQHTGLQIKNFFKLLLDSKAF